MEEDDYRYAYAAVAHPSAAVKREPCMGTVTGPEVSHHFVPHSGGMPPAGGEVQRTGEDVNNDGCTCGVHKIVGVKMPKYSGKLDSEAFHVQFELLAQVSGWTLEQKVLLLALCLSDNALSWLLLLDPSERAIYGTLVGPLRQCFRQCYCSESLWSELLNHWGLIDVESLARQAYANMPPDVQSELACDQFIRALFWRIFVSTCCLLACRPCLVPWR